MAKSANAVGIDFCNGWGERACVDAFAEFRPLVPEPIRTAVRKE
jgi:hypothetical protein